MHTHYDLKVDTLEVAYFRYHLYGHLCDAYSDDGGTRFIWNVSIYETKRRHYPENKNELMEVIFVAFTDINICVIITSLKHRPIQDLRFSQRWL
jgi:hypothetical protein